MSLTDLNNAQGFHEFKRKSLVTNFPREFADYVKSFGDFYFWPKGNFIVITKASMAKEAFKNSALSCDRTPFFLTRMPQIDLSLLEDFFGIVGKMMVMSDGKEHEKRRSLGTVGLREKLIRKKREKIIPKLDELFKKHLVNHQVDFAQKIAMEIPTLILAELFQIPEKDRSDFAHWSNVMTAFFGGGVGYDNDAARKVNNAAVKLRDYFHKEIDKRKKSQCDDDDFLSLMINQANVHGLDRPEIISQAIMMLVAGQVTTADQICNNLFTLVYNKDLFAKVKSNPLLINPMINELTRLDPAVTFIFRVAKDNCQIQGRKIEKGQTVFISTHCINRDVEIFHQGDNIDLESKSKLNFSFGFGSHLCLGQNLAIMEMQTVFAYLIENFQNIEFTGADTLLKRNHYSLSFSGFSEMNLTMR